MTVHPKYLKTIHKADGYASLYIGPSVGGKKLLSPELSGNSPCHQPGAGMVAAPLPHTRWVSLGENEQAIWGECQGSGKLPYQTQIDLRD